MPARPELSGRQSLRLAIAVMSLGSLALGIDRAVVPVSKTAVKIKNEQPAAFKQPAVRAHLGAGILWAIAAPPKQEITTSTTITTTTTMPGRAPTGILRRIGGCESGSGPDSPPDYTAENPTSSVAGGYQIETGTWDNFHGYSSANSAPPAVQTQKAEDLLHTRGTEPWDASKACWG